MRFEGKTIIVTGGAQGLGRACALAFAAEGGAVVIADIAAEAGQALAAEIGRRGGKALFVRADGGDVRDAGCLVDAALEWACGVDVLVSVGQGGASADFLELREADFDAALRANLKPAFLVGQAAARAMAARGHGTIVNVCGANDTLASPDRLTRVMALALADKNIRVNAVDRGPVESDPTRAVERVLSVASDAAGVVTGQCLDVDGAQPPAQRGEPVGGVDR